ncbi:hypothetical protein CSHISOI_11311 [Colletotrichum shisoi]|uniref:Uncharacterized protein n=1 Tax=Colletotrichum shisoi TaxID=2078593 RepID=A0A5Q4BB12_9PEZI|nr:hypothetical protein CSHISOI_11311 [Colletotrichum shisoi]
MSVRAPKPTAMTIRSRSIRLSRLLTTTGSWALWLILTLLRGCLPATTCNQSTY